MYKDLWLSFVFLRNVFLAKPGERGNYLGIPGESLYILKVFGELFLNIVPPFFVEEPYSRGTGNFPLCSRYFSNNVVLHVLLVITFWFPHCHITFSSLPFCYVIFQQAILVLKLRRYVPLKKARLPTEHTQQ